MRTWKFKPSYLRATLSDLRRVWQKSSLGKFAKKNPHSIQIIIIIVIYLGFVFTRAVFAESYIQEVGINRPELTQIKPLEAKKHKEVPLAVIQQIEPQKPVSAPTGGCVPDNKYASFIYLKESGCDPAAVNPSGCRGLGQACPGDKLPCTADFACQHDYFTQYANDRYGGWEQAYNAWQSQGWW